MPCLSIATVSSSTCPLTPLELVTRPLARLHLDYAGSIDGKMILVLIHSHSKWIEAFHMKPATSTAVMEELRTVFAPFGLPETIVTDNGTCFVTAEIKSFLKYNGIQHLTSAPYHPTLNGLAERAVQVVKKGLKKVTDGSLRKRLAKILLAYRVTPQSITGNTSGNATKETSQNQVGFAEAKHSRKSGGIAKEAKARHFTVGDCVYVRNYLQGDK